MQGQLFSQDFLHRGIRETPPYEALSDAQFDAFRVALRSIPVPLIGESRINEAQTEQLVIEEVVVELGWGDHYLPQVDLSGKWREDMPDVVLFPDASAKAATGTAAGTSKKPPGSRKAATPSRSPWRQSYPSRNPPASPPRLHPWQLLMAQDPPRNAKRAPASRRPEGPRRWLAPRSGRRRVFASRD